jgi:Holliday junction resolvase-like predicted endonuclease
MVSVEVDGLAFTFPDSCKVSKYDDWAFYRNQFSKMWAGIKAVDLLVIEGQIIWFIEVKDYRQTERTKAVDLVEEVAQKVFCTLAAMLPAKVHASNLDECQFAKEVVKGQQLRVVLHLEQPLKSSKLFPRAFNPSNIQLKLRAKIKPIDPHPIVVESTKMQSLSWTVTSNTS